MYHIGSKARHGCESVFAHPQCWSLGGSRLWGLSVALLRNLHPRYAMTKIVPMKPSVPSPVRDNSTISLRLLALILCSNCSNTFNKVLSSMWRHTVKLLFATSGHHFSLLNMPHGWSKHFTSCYDPSTPFTFIPPPPLSPWSDMFIYPRWWWSPMNYLLAITILRYNGHLFVC